jgi:endo-1,4-beta-xylanase
MLSASAVNKKIMSAGMKNKEFAMEMKRAFAFMKRNLYLLILAAFLLITGCPNTTDPEPAGPFVAVTDITGVPTGGTTGTAFELGAAAVVPANASNNTIAWTVKNADATGVTDKAVAEGSFTPPTAGTLTLTATIANGATSTTPFVKEFVIKISKQGDFVAVERIDGVPDGGFVGTEVDLTVATVFPDNADNKSIAWTVKDAGTTGVTNEAVAEGAFTPSAAGTLVLTATITKGKSETEDYTQDFTIAISEAGAFVAVTDITGVPEDGVAGSPVSLAGATVVPSNAANKTIVWTVKAAGAGVTSITGNSFTPTSAGEVTLTARILSGTADGPYAKDFTFTIAAAFLAVSGIDGLSATRNAVTGAPLALNSGISVVPAAATNKDIVWSVLNAGTTGLTDADVEDGDFTPERAGTVTLTATILNGVAQGSNYTRNVTYTIIKPVLSLKDVPAAGTKDHAVDLSGVSVEPADATNTAIVWNITNAGNTGVSTGTVADKKFTPTAAGTIELTATIADGSAIGTPFTQNYTITIYGGGQFTPEFGFGEDTTILLRGNLGGADQGQLSTDTVIEIAKGSVYYVSLITGSGGSYSDVVWYLNGTKQTISGSGSMIHLDTSAARTLKLSVIGKRNALTEGSGTYTFTIKETE